MTGVFLDTNVLVYVFDHDEPEKAQRARSLFEVAQREDVVLSAQVLSEFYVTVTRKLRRPLEPSLAAQAVNWLGQLRVVALDSSLVKAGVEISRSEQLSYWDGLIVASASFAGCDRLFTEDLNHGQIIGGVRVVNPFADRSSTSKPRSM